MQIATHYARWVTHPHLSGPAYGPEPCVSEQVSWTQGVAGSRQVKDVGADH